MAFAQIVTGGRVGTPRGDTPAYAAGSVGDLIVVAASLAKSVSGGVMKYYASTGLPTGWVFIAGGEQNGATTEYAKVIIARVADATTAGTVEIPKPGGGYDSAVSYRFAEGTWEGTIAGGIDAAFVGTESYDPPSLAPGWGSADIVWLAGLGSRETNYEFETTPTGFITLTDSRAVLSSNDNYSRAVSMEREETATSIDPSAFSITAGSNTPSGVYAFTIAVLSTSVRPGVTITDIKEPNQTNTLVASVTYPRIKVWSGTDDSGAENVLFDNEDAIYPITAGVLEVPLPTYSVNDVVTVEVMWTVSTERKLFIAEETVINLEAAV